jgi:hypothetical protein
LSEDDLIAVLELPVDRALVVSDLLLKEYNKCLQVGEGGLQLPPELGRLLEPARSKIRAAISPDGCSVELRDDEMVALGFALLAYLIHAKREDEGKQGVPLRGLKVFQSEALYVLAKLIECMAQAGMPTAGRLYQMGCMEGFFDWPEDEDSEAAVVGEPHT